MEEIVAGCTKVQQFRASVRTIHRSRTKNVPPLWTCARAAGCTVYLLRDYAEPWGSRLTVSLDQQLVASVANISYAAFRYPAGEHELHAEWPRIKALGKWDEDGLRVDETVTLEPGRTHDFVITGLRGNEDDPDVDEEDRYPPSLDITEVSESEGITLLEKLRHWRVW